MARWSSPGVSEGFVAMAVTDLAVWTPEEIEVLAAQLRRPDTAQSLLCNFLLSNEGVPQESLEPLIQIFETAAKIGHFIWPDQIRNLIAGKRVIDFGCGVTLYGAVFRALGAKSYVGIEPRLDMRKTTYRSRLFKGTYKASVSLSDVCRHVPNCAYFSSASDRPDERYDVAVMHTVTEHLLDIESVFREVASSLAPGGQVWFLHDNFYSWAGHHMAPHSLKSFDPSNPEHHVYSDWKHVSYDPAPDHPFITNLNRIRLDELKDVTSKYFDIEEWQEVFDGSEIRKRLTDDILAALPGMTERDLMVRHVRCLATVREQRAHARAA